MTVQERNRREKLRARNDDRAKAWIEETLAFLVRQRQSVVEVPAVFVEFGVPARGRVARDCDVGFSALSLSFFLGGRDCAPCFRFVPNAVRTVANSLRPSMLISGCD